MGTLFRQNDLKDGYRFCGFSGTHPSEPNLSTPTPPPPPRGPVAPNATAEFRSHSAPVVDDS